MLIFAHLISFIRLVNMSRGVSFETVIYRWQQAVPPTMSLVKNVFVIMNFAYTLLVLNYSCVGFMVRPLSLRTPLCKNTNTHIYNFYFQP